MLFRKENAAIASAKEQEWQYSLQDNVTSPSQHREDVARKAHMVAQAFWRCSC
jgi:hypothetical protein